jgi:PAS domain S-box-containing protein
MALTNALTPSTTMELFKDVEKFNTWYDSKRIVRVLDDIEAMKLWMDLQWHYPSQFQVRFNGTRNRFKSVNEAFADYIGLPPEKLSDINISDLLCEESISVFNTFNTRPFTESGLHDIKLGYKRPDGTIAWVLWQIHVYRKDYTLVGGIPLNK